MSIRVKPREQSKYLSPALYINSGRIKDTILNKAKREGQIVYGAQSIRKQVGISARETRDYDIFDKNPKQSAAQVASRIDRLTPENKDFYVKKGFNPGTWKVKHVGKDLRRGSKDDISIVDYTQTPSRVPKTVRIQGVKYRTLREELAAKQKLIRDKQYEYRRDKDLRDAKIIRRFLR